MAGDFKHKDVGGQLTYTEFHAADLHTLDGVQFGNIVIMSKPPSGYYKVVNFYCEKVGTVYKLVVEHSDVPEP